MGKPINILESAITSQGKIMWNDGRRRIDLKKPIRDLFEPLETEKQRINYMMEICLSKDKVMQRTTQLMNEGTIPILFYFTK
jgi:hypothetical protein